MVAHEEYSSLQAKTLSRFAYHKMLVITLPAYFLVRDFTGRLDPYIPPSSDSNYSPFQ